MLKMPFFCNEIEMPKKHYMPELNTVMVTVVKGGEWGGWGLKIGMLVGRRGGVCDGGTEVIAALEQEIIHFRLQLLK